MREGGEREGLEGECWGGPNPRERVGGGGRKEKAGREARVEALEGGRRGWRDEAVRD